MKNIYQYLKNELNINTNYIFRRDYIQSPLQKIIDNTGNHWEKPYKEDLKYLYIELNITRNDLQKLFNIPLTTFKRILRNYDIKKSVDKYVNNTKKYVVSTYGVENIFQINSIKEKSKNTKLIKYGDINYHNMEKTKYTNTKKYGVENIFKKKEYIINCFKKKYGVEHALQIKKFFDKAKNTLKERYGDENYRNPKKIYETKMKNGTITGSNEENTIYNLLIQKYPKVIRQYKDVRYPYSCDFYIPSEDLFIEYQGYFSHGGEPYLGTLKQLEKVNLWKSKSKEINFNGKNKNYIKYIKEWCIRDVEKRNTAKNNNLNFLEFFNMNQFIKWYNGV